MSELFWNESGNESNFEGLTETKFNSRIPLLNSFLSTMVYPKIMEAILFKDFPKIIDLGVLAKQTVDTIKNYDSTISIAKINFNFETLETINALYDGSDFHKINSALKPLFGLGEINDFKNRSKLINFLDNPRLTNLMSNLEGNYKIEHILMDITEGFAVNHFKYFKSLPIFEELMERRHGQFVSNAFYNIFKADFFTKKEEDFFLEIKPLLSQQDISKLTTKIEKSYIQYFKESTEQVLRFFIKNDLIDINNPNLSNIFSNSSRESAISEKERVETERVFLEKVSKKAEVKKKLKM